jgi:threonine synthase
VPDWIAEGKYLPRPSVQTLSNAMDVGDPSNFERIQTMYALPDVRRLFASYWLDDEGTLKAIDNCHARTGYILDPHGAVAWQAWNDIRRSAMEKLLAGEENPLDVPGLTANIPDWASAVSKKQAVGIVLETAHPAKFGDTVKAACGREPSLPDRLEKVLKLPDHATPITADYYKFRVYLQSSFRQ